MSRFIYIMALAFVLFNYAEASAERHGGGIKGGLLISSPTGDVDEYDLESINTITYGAFYRYLFSNRLSSQTEVLYSKKGSKGEYFWSDGQINIEYLELALLVQYRLYNNNTIFNDLYIGPIFSLRLDANVEREIFGETQSYGITDDIKPNDIGVVLGAKFGFKHEKNEFGIDVRYSSGFITPDDTGAEIELKNRTFTIMLEMYFGKK